MVYIAAYIYWVVVALWLTILSSVVYFYVRNPRAFGTTRLLLTVIGIDTFRNIAENAYFGVYFGGTYGLFPSWARDILGRPELLILPKFVNVIAGCVVLGLLLFVWLPNAVREWKQSEQRAQDLTALAAVDPLTGIYNRRHFETVAQAELARAQRYMRPLSVLIVDIDFFKRVNDTFGHEMGDWILKMVATAITSVKRDPDVVARLGGEEFILLLPETSLPQAERVADRIREIVRKTSDGLGKEQLVLTVSIGVAEASARGTDYEAALRDADRALYEAKRTGRNKVCAAKPAIDTLLIAAE